MIITEDEIVFETTLLQNHLRGFVELPGQIVLLGLNIEGPTAHEYHQPGPPFQGAPQASLASHVLTSVNTVIRWLTGPSCSSSA